MYMANCPSCGFKVELNWKVCPSCTNPLVFPSSINQDNVSAADSVIQGDQFSGTKAETIIINQYGNGAGNNVPTNDSSTNSKAIENTPTPIVEDQPLKKCSRCKLELTDSLQPINCVEPDCEESMCSSCYGLWRVPQMHSWQYCQQHTESHRKEYELHRQKCSSCKTVIGYGIESANCEFDECNNTMCMTCYTTWHVNDPTSVYRADSGPWNYCKTHTQQSIDDAKQQLETRIHILNDFLNQNISEWTRKEDQQSLERKKGGLTIAPFGFALIFSILIYPGKLFVMSKIGGWLFTLYNILCFWLMIPIALFVLAMTWDEYADDKKSIQQTKDRLGKPYSIGEFRLTPNQNLTRSWSMSHYKRRIWDDKNKFNSAILRDFESLTLIDYEPDRKIIITKDQYSDGTFWTDESTPKEIGLDNKTFVIEDS